MMANVFDVAKYILQKQGAMSTWKLQKLCYYSQAWQLAWTGKPLFEEEFEAWTNGPVCRELFNAHRGSFWIDEAMIDKGDPSNLNADEQETIDIVLHGYGDREPYDLREQTHSEPPWKDARVGLPDSAPSQRIISKDSMGSYYGSL